ncbi:MAG TPA: spore germination protein, partial [Candidatus Sulfotelmatobacter sp.]|nr:spore germination protein [Candidatus Sulfotelmatobacter sp.]
MALKTGFSKSLAENEQTFRELIGSQRGAVFRKVPLPGPPEAEVLLVFFDVENDPFRLESMVIRPLLEGEVRLDELPKRLVPAGIKMQTVMDAISYVYRGKVLLLRDGSADVYALEVAKPPTRALEPPETESGVSGPREAFGEIHVINLALLRRRYPGPDLRIESLWIGQDARLEVSYVYL